MKTLTGFVESETSELARRFRREIQVASLLRDPHIVEAHDSGEAFVDGRPLLYLVMEEIPGEPLNRLLDARTPSLAEITRWGDGICAALSVMHRAGIVHRDLKPANVMIGPDGHATVLDFGIARLEGEGLDLSTLTRSGHLVGTFAYMSPEQAIGATALDGRSDLYALGCLLYAALVGRPPFSEGPWHRLLRQHVDEAPLPPGALRDGLPAAWDTLVLDLLAKAPGDRPPSAAAVRERIAALPLPVDAPPPPVAAPSRNATVIDPDAITSDASAVVGVPANPNDPAVLGGGGAVIPSYPSPSPNPKPASDSTPDPAPTPALTRPLPGSALPPPRVLSGDEVISRSLTTQQLLAIGVVVLVVLSGLVTLSLVVSGRKAKPVAGHGRNHHPGRTTRCHRDRPSLQWLRLRVATTPGRAAGRCQEPARNRRETRSR